MKEFVSLIPVFYLKDGVEIMPVTSCQKDGNPGFKWGEEGHCYTYDQGNSASRLRARLKAEAQGRAIKVSQSNKGGGGR